MRRGASPARVARSRAMSGGSRALAGIHSRSERDDVTRSAATTRGTSQVARPPRRAAKSAHPRATTATVACTAPRSVVARSGEGARRIARPRPAQATTSTRLALTSRSRIPSTPREARSAMAPQATTTCFSGKRESARPGTTLRAHASNGACRPIARSTATSAAPQSGNHTRRPRAEVASATVADPTKSETAQGWTCAAASAYGAPA